MLMFKHVSASGKPNEKDQKTKKKIKKEKRRVSAEVSAGDAAMLHEPQA